MNANPTIIVPVPAPSEPKPARKPRSSSLSEALVRQEIPGGWRQVYGSLGNAGVSIECHDFEAGSSFEWSRSFRPGCLELCLNLAGHGWIRGDGKGMDFGPRTAGFYVAGKGGLKAGRDSGQQHRFVAVEFSARFLDDKLAQCDGALHPLVERFIRGGACRAAIGGSHRLTIEQERSAAQLAHPPVAQAARSLWYQSKVLELVTEFFFERQDESELFCDRQKRLARERVDRVIAVLRGRLAQPPNLGGISREVGCSPFHLSRTFSQEMGMTIPQYLRKLRMEHAGDLLRSGKYNVTEAALEVGYSSLSHFSQAFCQTMGCCPGLYPLNPAKSPNATVR